MMCTAHINIIEMEYKSHTTSVHKAIESIKPMKEN